jgi:hypothetical protein
MGGYPVLRLALDAIPRALAAHQEIRPFIGIRSRRRAPGHMMGIETKGNPARLGHTAPVGTLTQRAKAMRIHLHNLLLISMLGSCAALAQNSDLGLQFGVSLPTGAVVNGQVSGTVGWTVQLNYALQLREAQAGDLYLELPLLFGETLNGVIDTTVRSSNRDQIYFTPGARWRFTVLRSRVSIYAAAGGGVASFSRNVDIVGNGTVSASSSRTESGAFDFGGGIDFRLTRFLSLRAEGRDFITRPGLGDSSGRNHPFFTAGFGFHF